MKPPYLGSLGSGGVRFCAPGEVEVDGTVPVMVSGESWAVEGESWSVATGGRFGGREGCFPEECLQFLVLVESDGMLSQVQQRGRAWD